MRRSFSILILLILVWLFSGCIPAHITAIPASTSTGVLFPTPGPSTDTPTRLSTPTAEIKPLPPPSPTLPVTASPFPTPEPQRASEIIRALLQEPADCPASCFAGIAPGDTTFKAAKNYLANLGLGTEETKPDNGNFLAGASADSKESYILLNLTVNDNLITDIRVVLTPESQREGLPRDWLAYSPEMMIRRYGQPSKVNLFMGRGPSATPVALLIYFDNADIISEYYISDIRNNSRICPLSDQFASVRLWIGKHPLDPPPELEPLEKVTFLTTESFSELMTGDPKQACFNLRVDRFP